MKKIKQIFSVILALLMLITAVPVQSFAAWDFFYPTVDKIEYAKDVKPLSYKKIMSQSKGSDDGYVYNSYDSNFNVYFSDGKKFESINFSIGHKGIEAIVFTECINVAECTEVINQGKTTVNVDVNVSVVYRGRPTVYRTFTLERPIVKEFVKNITFVDTLPELPEDEYSNDNFAFVGKEFEIEYADGTKKVAAVEETEFDFLLDGKSISIDYDDSYYYDEITNEKVYYTGYTVEFVDAITILDKQIHICNYSKLELLDYSFNDNGKLSSATYRLTHNDGSVLEKTCTFNEGIGALTFDDTVIDTVDGYDVKVNLLVSPSFLRQNAYCFVTISYGFESWDLSASEHIEDFTEICDCRCHRSGIIYIFNQIVFKLQEIFGRETECQCGTTHTAVS